MIKRATLLIPQKTECCTNLEAITKGSMLLVNNTQLAVSEINQQGDKYKIEALRRDISQGKEAVFVINYESTKSELKKGKINDIKSIYFSKSTSGFRNYSEKLKLLELKNKQHPW